MSVNLAELDAILSSAFGERIQIEALGAPIEVLSNGSPPRVRWGLRARISGQPESTSERFHARFPNAGEAFNNILMLCPDSGVIALRYLW